MNNCFSTRDRNILFLENANVQRQSFLAYQKRARELQVVFWNDFKCPYPSSLLAIIIVYFCKYYHNQSSRKSLRFPKNRGKNWNAVFASYFLIQNKTTIKNDRFLTVQLKVYPNAVDKLISFSPHRTFILPWLYSFCAQFRSFIKSFNRGYFYSPSEN